MDVTTVRVVCAVLALAMMILALPFVMAWLVRMMIAKNFRGFHFEVARCQATQQSNHALDLPRRIRYGEAVRVGWLFAWRSYALSLLFAFIIYGIQLAVSAESQLLSLVIFVVQALMYLFLLSPWVVRMMVRKAFQGFRIRVVRYSSESTTGALNERGRSNTGMHPPAQEPGGG